MDYDIIRFLSEYRIPFTSTGNEWVSIQCPMCDDQGMHLGLNLLGSFGNCFRCGGHSFREIVQNLLKTNNFQTDEILSTYSGRGLVLSQLNKKKASAKTIELPGGPLLPMHRKYLMKRRFDPDFLVEKYHIQGEGIVGDWKYRIIIPIIVGGKIVSFQGRDVSGKSDIRYKTLEVEESVIAPKETLYNIDHCKEEEVVVVEGVFDCWRMGDGCVATLGTGMTETQINLLKKFKRVFFLFDPEEEAQRRAMIQGTRLAAFGITVKIINTQFDHDPGDMTEEEVKDVWAEIKSE